MARKITAQTPTDEDIMAYNNVPVDIAAKYIGWSSCNVYRALQQERAPFGMAAQTSETTWTYNISPGLLVKYKNGDLHAYRLNEVKHRINRPKINGRKNWTRWKWPLRPATWMGQVRWQ